MSDGGVAVPAGDQPPRTVITEHGLYPGIPPEVYHGDPWPGGSLSSSGARRILRSPATFRYGPDVSTAAMEFGTAAHAQLLGAGAEVVEVAGAANGAWSTNDAKAAVSAARESGQVPVKPEAYRKIKAMTAKLAEHRSAAALFAGDSGWPEVSGFWPDPVTGVTRRMRVDWLPHGADGLCVIPDYKTTTDASWDAVSKQIARLGYHLAADWYCAGVRHFRPGIETRFVLVVQETEPPYLVACYQLDADALAEGARRNAIALEKYRDCRASGVWPGYDPEEGITLIGLPRWGYVPTYQDW